MPLRSTRSFSGKLLKRYRSKTDLKKDKTEEPVPALPTLSGLDIGISLNVPFAQSNSPSTSAPLPKSRIHRRSRSFSELLSIASNTTTNEYPPAQPWRDREAWAAIHSPTQRPVRSRKEGSVLDRSYGWMERDPEKMLNRRDVKGRGQFKFFHNVQNTSSASLGEGDRGTDTRDIGYPGNPHGYVHGRSRLNESTSTSSSHTALPPPVISDTRPISADDSSSTISSMDLSTNPHTPPTSIDQHSSPHSHHPLGTDTPRSATSIYSNDDLPLPPLLPHNVKRADSPPAFTSRFPTQIPWAQRSTLKDSRESSNLKWVSGTGSASDSPPPLHSLSDDTPVPAVSQPVREIPKTPPPEHRRKRSMTAPSIFDNATKQVRPESGTLPNHISGPSPPRPPRHPKRQIRAPPPIPVETDTPVMAMPIAFPYPHVITPSSNEEWVTPMTSPLAHSPVKGPSPSPSAYYKPTMPLRSVGSAQSLRPGGARRPSTAPTHGSPITGKSIPIRGLTHVHPSPVGGYPTSPPSSTTRNFDRVSRNTSASSATRGGWI